MHNFHSLVKEPESLVTIRFQDCDPFGHLNNARYIDYFLNARQDQLVAHYNLRTYEPDKPAASSWVVKKNQIAYLRPALIMAEVLIRTRLIHFTENVLVMEGLMLDQETRHLKALIWIEFAYVSLVTGRPANHPDEFMQLCRALVVAEDYDADGFNKRVESARHQFRKRLSQSEKVTVGAI